MSMDIRTLIVVTALSITSTYCGAGTRRLERRLTLYEESFNGSVW